MKKQAVLEEKSTSVLMYPSEIKKILDMLFKEDGFYGIIEIEKWADIQGGLPKHLMEVLKNIEGGN